MSRLNSFLVLAKSNDRAQALLDDVVPDYARFTATALAAEELARELRSIATQSPAWPACPDDLTAEWLSTEVNRRLGATKIDTQLAVLREVINTSQDEAVSLLFEHRDDLIEALAQDLEGLVDEISDAVDQLGPGTFTAAAAIEADAADAWKQISTAIPIYVDIRRVQLELYRSTDFEKIDRAACGDGIQVYDSEARLYYHRNLDAVAPDWRPGLALDGRQRDSSLPWPSDPTERLVWCIRHDTGIWCPTTGELAAVTTGGVPPRLQGGNRESQSVFSVQVN